MSASVEQRARQLSGLRRAMYHAGISRGLTPERAYQAAAARRCNPTDGTEHTAACAASWED